MAVRDDLLALEKRFWTDDAEFYRNTLDEKCLVAFTDMAGVMAKNDIADMVKKDPPKWRDFVLEPKGFVEPTDNMALLSYHAKGKRGTTGEIYEAIVSSAYVKRDGRWKLTFHQHTPLEKAKAAAA